MSWSVWLITDVIEDTGRKRYEGEFKDGQLTGQG